MERAGEENVLNRGESREEAPGWKEIDKVERGPGGNPIKLVGEQTRE